MSRRELIELAESVLNTLRAQATGGVGDPTIYQAGRAAFGGPEYRAVAPAFLRTCASLGEFWEHIKAKEGQYQGRRQYLRAQFQPLLDQLELGSRPSDASVNATLIELEPGPVHEAWQKALQRRDSDPEGAITSARTLLESVMKLILSRSAVVVDNDADLPKLYREVATVLRLAPSQHTELIFKQILGGCSGVVEGLGSLRNRLGDAHGQGPAPVRPLPRHAELAVNLAGTMAQFLVATWRDRKVDSQ